VSSGPYLCSSKRASEVDLGSPLQLGGGILRHRKDSGDATKTFLLAKTSTGGQQVYQLLHCLRYFQNNH
jgi:hypothetical protein